VWANVARFDRFGSSLGLSRERKVDRHVEDNNYITRFLGEKESLSREKKVSVSREKKISSSRKKKMRVLREQLSYLDDSWRGIPF
jgi:hypothetical protein